MPNSDKKPVAVKLEGQPIGEEVRPRLLSAGVRAAGAAADPFLPPGLVKVAAAFDVSRRSREAGGARTTTLAVRPDQVLVLELADGFTLITSPDQLRETLERIDPDAIEDGAVPLDALRRRGEATRGWLGDAGDLVSRVFALDLGVDDIVVAAKRKALEWLGENVEAKLAEYADLGVTWVGTKALMWAIENRLARAPGLYRWTGAQGGPEDLVACDEARLSAAVAQGPLLVFIHGTGSSTAGSFNDLQTANRDDWRALEAKFGERIFAFEHRTMSESPIENAVALARALPAGAQVNLVTHSRGGLVGDLLCLGQFDDALIEGFALGAAALAGTQGEARERLRKELTKAYAEHRSHLRELREILRNKAFRMQRYVRVACPARGTRLASSNFDLFLSGLLWVIGNVPYLAGNPLYSAFKRVVLEIAKNRTNPNLVPGIEAMLPNSPTGRFLVSATPADGMQLAVIAGDIEGGGLLKRLGVLFTDFVFFDRYDNDLVVDTDSMYAGVARAGAARRRFEQGPSISHFGYFANRSSRSALCDWLTKPDPALLTDFEAMLALPSEISLAEERQQDRAISRARGGEAIEASLPVVVVLPGILASHLRKSTNDRIWFDPADIVLGRLDEIRWGNRDIEAEKLFDAFYGDLCRHLLASHRVERFAYDWRLPLSDLADHLERRLRSVLDATAQPARPVRVLAHSMGGLVVRALIAKHGGIWDELMQREGARFIMLGTPNQGSHSMLETLLGKSDSMRNLARIDQQHDLQGVLDIVAEFRGALQLLPKPGFKDVGAAQAAQRDYYLEQVWKDFKQVNKDFWFGDGIAAVPLQAALDEARWLWTQDGEAAPALAPRHQDKVIYVFGRAANTPCGVTEQGRALKMIGTAMGDGSVTWKSGEISGIGSFFTMPVEHGALTDSEEHFAALAELLERGATDRLARGKPVLRAAEQERTVVYDAGPVPYPSAEEVVHSLLGARPPKRAKTARARPLAVSCVAMDLRHATMPVMVGHYEQDPISGAEALIDRELVRGELTLRHHLGLYAGAPGTATVVLIAPNEQERLRGSSRGAVVTGLGKYGELSTAALTEAVRVGTLRYLLQLVDNRITGDSGPLAGSDVYLSSLLLGHNSTTNISVEDSVSALLRGVLAANRQFAQTMRSDLRVTRLELIEVYIDTAIAAAKALGRVAERIREEATRFGMRVEASAELQQRRGWWQRLDISETLAYWPRMIVTDDDRHEDECPPECYERARRTFVSQPGSTAAEAQTAAFGHIELAQCLRFAYFGQRARAETKVQQRQPGLVDRLVDKAIRSRGYSEDFSCALFQLLVPHEFKDAVRQMDRVALVVDGYTANFPWELMLADAEPLAVRIAMVRQLVSARYRPHVRQTVDRVAYVVGNPSSAGFGRVFVDAEGKAQSDPEPLGGAEEEARAVAKLLALHGYQVAEAIGSDQTALDVINKLYRHPYRLVHIAAHGIFEQRAMDGTPRSGVVLSDGMLITAAEIEAMEVVPDLVFLNCCHLGKIDRGPVAFNRLAYSVARQLIEIGVRAVVVAGWPVDDTAASLFAEVFYDELLGANRRLGDAVFAARRRVYERHREGNTWGAYQVYGDPGFVMDPHVEPERATRAAAWKPVAPEELVQRLANMQAAIACSPNVPSPSAAGAHAADAERALAACPDKWRELPQVSAVLAMLYAELGGTYFATARDHFLAAICAEDRQGKVPIQAIEQLANIEARQAEESGDEALIESALERLHRLWDSTAGEGAAKGAAPQSGNAERAAVLGSAYKRKAALLARQLLAGGENARERFQDALAKSIAWYRRAEGKSGTPDFRPYHALNRLGLQAAHDWNAGAPPTGEGVQLARASALRAREDFRTLPDLWNAVMPGEALLIERLLDRTLALPGAAGDQALAAVGAAYKESLSNVPVTPRNRDSVVQQICLLKLFVQVQALAQADDRAELAADRLEALAAQLVTAVARTAETVRVKQ